MICRLCSCRRVSKRDPGGSVQRLPAACEPLPVSTAGHTATGQEKSNSGRGKNMGLDIEQHLQKEISGRRVAH